MSIGLYIVLAPLYLKSVRKLQEKRFVFVKILAIIIPENGAKVSKIKCFQFAQQTLSIEERSYSEFEDIDLIIFTAAAPLILGQNRLDMLETSKEIVKEVIPQIMASGFHGIIIVVTNPVDIVSYLIYKFSGLTNKKVIGTGTFLDTLRLKRERSEVFNEIKRER